MLEFNPTNPPRFCCIVLHGLGASGNDLRPLAPSLWPASAVRWLFPDAPVRPITINGGLPMRGWYDVLTPNLLAREDSNGIQDSAKLITELITSQVNNGIPRERIALIGFSQGGALALYAGLRQPEKLFAIVGLSCYLPLASTLQSETEPSTKSTPIFLGAGDLDPVIPMTDTQATGELLRDSGCLVQFQRYAMLGHAINPEEIYDVATFLGNTGSA